MTDTKDTVTQPLPTPGAGSQMMHVAIHSIARSLTNPRKRFDQAKLQELADSIKASGVHQPILLRPLPAHRLQETFQEARAQKLPAPEYELVAGERRWRASQLAGESQIPAMIRPMTDGEALEAQVIENLQREDVTALEEAEGYQVLMESQNISVDEVAKKIGKSRSYVFSRLKILDLCEHGRELLREGKLDFSCALPIARIPSEQLQLKALGWAVQTTYVGDRMSARSVLRHVQDNYMLELKHAPFDTADAALCPAAGDCKGCSKRTGANPDMFDLAEVGADVCTDPPCYHSKEEAHTIQVRERAVASGTEIISGREAKALIPTSYTSSIEGHLRMDVATDCPIKGKTLRAVVGKVMEQAGIKHTLIENPHSKELVAVVSKAQAAELLAMAGKADAEASVREAAKEDGESKARQAQRDAAEKYEREWRALLAERTIQAFCSSLNLEAKADEAAELAVTQHVLNTLNKETATRLAKILELDKVAPQEALHDHAKEHKFPIVVAAAVLLLRDAEYTPWLETATPGKHNALLLNMAELCKVDAGAIKAEVQANIRAATEAEKAKSAPVKSVAPKPELPLTPAARTNGGVGTGKAKKTKGPAALAGGGRKQLTADEASASIAQAMQALGEPDLGADAQGHVAEPVAAGAAQALPPSSTVAVPEHAWPFPITPAAAGTGESAGGGLTSADAKTGAAEDKLKAERPPEGTRVRIIKAKPGSKQERHLDCEGTVTRHAQRNRLDVKLANLNPKVGVPVFLLFEVDEVEVIE